MVYDKAEAMTQITDTLTSPQAALPIGGSVAGLQILGVTLPEVINVLVAIYTMLLIVHKGYQMYNEWKKRKDESN